MDTGVRVKCPGCGAWLRRGRPAGSRCDPCLHRGATLALPPGFYSGPVVSAALAAYDFGRVFRAIRATTGLSQRQFGDLVGLEQVRVSDIETGARPLVDVRIVAQVASRCGIPAVSLGFGGATVAGTGITAAPAGRKVDPMDRRDFVASVATMALGVGSMDLDRLLALLPQDEPVTSRRIGASDVAAIEDTTDEFRRQDYAHGSGLTRDAAVAQLRAVLPLLGAQVVPEVRPRLQVAIAELALIAGWMSFEVMRHDSTRQLWTIALDAARSAGSPEGADLAVFALYDMALQSTSLGDPDEALRLAQLGHAAAVGEYPITAATRCCLVNGQARAHATRGDAAATQRALEEAAQHAADAERDPGPTRWGGSTVAAGMAAYQGSTRYTLASALGDPGVASRAVDLLRDGVDGFTADYGRLPSVYLPALAGAHALAGDVDTAVAVGHHAVDAATAVHSPRSREKLGGLRDALEPMRTSPGVAELRDRLATTAA